MGTALANYQGFEKSNFTVVALFDNDASKIGEHIGSGKIPVHDVKKITRVVKEEAVDVAVIAVPARAAQRVLNQVTAGGVKAVLNFAPASLNARLGVKVKTVDLTTSLDDDHVSAPAAARRPAGRGHSPSPDHPTTAGAAAPGSA